MSAHITGQFHKYTKPLLIIAFFHELFFSIPLLGVIVTWTSAWIVPLLSGLCIHGIVLYFLQRDNCPLRGAPVVGLIASIIAAVPVFGWMAHALATFLYFVTIGGLFGNFVIGDQHHKGRASEANSNDRESKVRDAEIID